MVLNIIAQMNSKDQSPHQDRLSSPVDNEESTLQSSMKNNYQTSEKQKQPNLKIPKRETTDIHCVRMLMQPGNSKIGRRGTKTRDCNSSLSHMRVSLVFLLLCIAIAILGDGHRATIGRVEAANQQDSSVVARVTGKLSSGGARLVRTLELAKSSGQINDWLVHQVAPAMATKLIDNVLQAPSSSSKKSKPNADSESTKSSPIDTQALADKIIDKLADSIKKRKMNSNADAKKAGQKDQTNHQESADESTEVSANMNQSEPKTKQSSRGSHRKGKSLISDSVQQVVHNLFPIDNRKLFGRAIERSKNPLRARPLDRGHSSSYAHNSSNSWQLIKEPNYQESQPQFVSTESSHLDENPVVLRAEHRYNLTTETPPSAQHQYQQQQQQLAANQNQNLSPLISSLMSSTATNQIGEKLLQKHRLQQKYVHTNRHNQHQTLSPKPWPVSGSNSGRRQQQSPYTLPTVTSDMNIVMAPSSPPPPTVSAPPMTTSTTTTTTSTTTPNPLPIFPSSIPYLGQANKLVVSVPTSSTSGGLNKFKLNIKHQHPSSMSASSSWYQNNRNHPYHQSSNQRFQHHIPITTSTTSTTTTTTTTTTPEPTQTEPALTEAMDSLLDLDRHTSALSSVAQAALESLNQAGSIVSPSSNSDDSQSDNNSSSNSSYSLTSGSSSSSSSSGVKGASPSTTTARHSVISAEAIPTALGAPLYHLTRPNFIPTTIMGPPPRRGSQSPAAKVAAQYLQKGLNHMSTTIFGRQSKSWARRLGISSMLLSGILYGAAIMANPGAPLPTSGLQVLKALTKTKRRRGSDPSLLPSIVDQKLAVPLTNGLTNSALLDNNNVNNILLQQPQLIPIIEHLIQQEQQQQQQQQQNSLFSERSLRSSPIEIQSFEPDQVSRRDVPSQIFSIHAMSAGNSIPEFDYNNRLRASNLISVPKKR